jgi:hypothetical protein
MNLKILLINNKESPQISLEKFLKNYGTVDVIHFQSISIWEILKTYIFKRPDLIVLSGRDSCWVMGSDCAETRETYAPVGRHQTVYELQVRNNVSPKASGRGMRTDLLIHL